MFVEITTLRTLLEGISLTAPAHIVSLIQVSDAHLEACCASYAAASTELASLLVGASVVSLVGEQMPELDLQESVLNAVG